MMGLFFMRHLIIGFSICAIGIGVAICGLICITAAFN